MGSIESKSRYYASIGKTKKKREYVKDKVESIKKVRERAHAPYRKRKFVGEKFRLTGKQALLSWR